MNNNPFDPNDRLFQDKVEEEIHILEAYTQSNTLDDESEIDALSLNIE